MFQIARFSATSQPTDRRRQKMRRPASGQKALADSHAIFVRNLRYWLETRNVKAAQLAARIGISRATVTAWIKGRSSPELLTVGKIADALDIAIGELFVDGGNSRTVAKRPSDFHDPDITPEQALRRIARDYGLEVRRKSAKEKG